MIFICLMGEEKPEEELMGKSLLRGCPTATSVTVTLIVDRFLVFIHIFYFFLVLPLRIVMLYSLLYYFNVDSVDTILF